jgi:hypothetical protein
MFGSMRPGPRGERWRRLFDIDLRIIVRIIVLPENLALRG